MTRLATIVLAAAFALPCSGAPDRETPSATLPFDTVLELYREQDRARDAEPPAPPVPAVVHRVGVQARLLDTAVMGTAKISGAVLAEDEWVRLALLELGPGAQLTRVPDPANGALTVADGRLYLVSRTKGRFELTVEFRTEAVVDGLERQASLAFPSAVSAAVELAHDRGLFDLLDASAEETAEGMVVYPTNGAVDLRWRRTRAAAPVVERAARPARESVIREAHASVVSTLEGEQITRVLYRLAFTGREQVTFELPEGANLARAYLNRVPVPVPDAERAVTLDVAPANPGEEEATLELVLTGEPAGFLLSGRRRFALPGASWRVNRMFVRLHLPRVFNYAWAGGSLSPAAADEATGPIGFAYDIPAAGKSMRFRQFLVHGAAPSVALDYTVDLEGRYFRVADR